MTAYYGGWLYTDENERQELLDLGVFGPMIWTPDNGPITTALGKTGNMSHCYCSEETLHKLDDKYGEMWRTKYPHYDEYPSKYPSDHFSIIKRGKGERWDKYLPNDADTVNVFSDEKIIWYLLRGLTYLLSGLANFMRWMVRG
jgi:hypothetical protein